MTENVSLQAAYSGALKALSKVIELPPSSPQKQPLIAQSREDLKTVHARIIELSLFSPNETVEDISTKDLIYLSLPYALSEAQSRVQADSRSARLESLDQTQRYMKSFVSLLENYNIVPAPERELFEKQASSIRDPAKKRELKINQFKKEKDLKNRIQANDLPSNFDLIESLLPPPSDGEEEKELDSQSDEDLRETILLLLRLLYAQAQGQLEGLSQEVELLKMAPPSPTLHAQSSGQDERTKAREEEASMWRLDPTPAQGGPDGKGPLLDQSGKVLRPFTILPSDAGERQRLQAGVFGPGHNLPTMSIDEYLEIEGQRGNIITGGGPASQNAPTSSEQLQIDSEMDGTAEGEEKAEQKRQKDENWAQFTDANQRGAGNTMNRG
ncbi:hypothetical protein H1R20_g7097, partial [Candolleomyces eurysporus]